MQESSSKVTKWIFVLGSALTLAAIVSSFYIFFLQKDYSFTVEAKCDPSQQICFIRSCEEEGECPSNNFENYKLYTVSASDFSKCSDGTCAAQCLSGEIECEEVTCDEDAGDTCQFHPMIQVESEPIEEVLEE